MTKTQTKQYNPFTDLVKAFNDTNKPIESLNIIIHKLRADDKSALSDMVLEILSKYAINFFGDEFMQTFHGQVGGIYHFLTRDHTTNDKIAVVYEKAAAWFEEVLFDPDELTIDKTVVNDIITADTKANINDWTEVEPKDTELEAFNKKVKELSFVDPIIRYFVRLQNIVLDSGTSTVQTPYGIRFMFTDEATVFWNKVGILTLPEDRLTINFKELIYALNHTNDYEDSKIVQKILDLCIREMYTYESIRGKSFENDSDGLINIISNDNTITKVGIEFLVEECLEAAVEMYERK